MKYYTKPLELGAGKSFIMSRGFLSLSACVVISSTPTDDRPLSLSAALSQRGFTVLFRSREFYCTCFTEEVPVLLSSLLGGN